MYCKKLYTHNTPSGVRRSALVTWRNSLYLLGGNPEEERCTSDFYRFQNNVWKRIRSFDAPSPRSGHSVVIYKDNLIVFGGAGRKWYNCTYMYDLMKNCWKKLSTNGEKPGPRDGHVAVVHGDEMVIFGGMMDWNVYTETYALDLKNFRWRQLDCRGEIPEYRMEFCGVYYKGNLIIHGGCGGSMSEVNEMYSLDIDSCVWKKLYTNHSPALSAHAVAVENSKLYLFGGHYKNGLSNDFYVYDFERFEWKKIELFGDIPNKMQGHKIAIMNSRLYIFGGGYQEVFYNDLYEITLEYIHLQMEMWKQAVWHKFVDTEIITT